MIEELRQFINDHAIYTEVTSMRPDAAYVGFARVYAREGTDPKTLLRLVAENRPGSRLMKWSPFDGKAHSFHDIATWLGSHDLAQAFIGLSASLGIAHVSLGKEIDEAGMSAAHQHYMIDEGMFFLKSDTREIDQAARNGYTQHPRIANIDERGFSPN